MRILKIHSLPTKKEWVDRRDIMLHACFQLLEDCITEEGVDTHCSYEAHKEFVDEVRALNSWWQKRKEDELFDNDEEDDIMLSRLMKIRTGLWT